MKKSRHKEKSSLQPEDKLWAKSAAENSILVFLVLAIFLLAASLLSGKLQFPQTKIKPSPPETRERYAWLTDFPGKPDGLYVFTPEELKTDFPAIQALWNQEESSGEADPQVQAFQYEADRAKRILLPPAVANVFFQPIPINRADKDILTSLPGIGPQLAERIVQWRDQHGPFRAKDELLQVAGIGPKKFAGLVDRVTLD